MEGGLETISTTARGREIRSDRTDMYQEDAKDDDDFIDEDFVDEDANDNTFGAGNYLITQTITKESPRFLQPFCSWFKSSEV